jgi:hypothetical protein
VKLESPDHVKLVVIQMYARALMSEKPNAPIIISDSQGTDIGIFLL